MAHAYKCDVCGEYYIHGGQVSIDMISLPNGKLAAPGDGINGYRNFDVCPDCGSKVCEVLGIKWDMVVIGGEPANPR